MLTNKKLQWFDKRYLLLMAVIAVAHSAKYSSL